MPEIKQLNMSNITVYETTDYDMFHYIDGNRSVDPKHVKELAKSIGQYGQQVLVLITPDYGIYDGQNRIEACKQLGIPVKWIFVDGEKTAEDISNLNSSQKPWKERDYLESLATRGSAPAERLLRLMDEFHLSRRYVVLAAGRDTWTMDPLRSRKDRKNVSFDPFSDKAFSEQDAKAAEDRLRFAVRMIRILARYGKVHQKTKLIEAFVAVDKAEGFNRKRLADVLEKNGNELPLSCSTISPIIKRIAKIYNANKKNNFMDLYFMSDGRIKRIVCTAKDNRWAQD